MRRDALLADQLPVHSRGSGFGLRLALFTVGSVSGPITTAIGAVFWGLQMGMLQGLLAVSVAEAAPADLRGTAFGIYYFVDGVASLLASSLAGILWASGGSSLTFLAGALLACAVGGMLLVKPLPR